MCFWRHSNGTKQSPKLNWRGSSNGEEVGAFHLWRWRLLLLLMVTTWFCHIYQKLACRNPSTTRQSLFSCVGGISVHLEIQWNKIFSGPRGLDLRPRFDWDLRGIYWSSEVNFCMLIIELLWPTPSCTRIHSSVNYFRKTWSRIVVVSCLAGRSVSSCLPYYDYLAVL